MSLPNLERENELREQSYVRVIGIDEAGRGPLAGPVVAAACLLPSSFRHDWLNDSKKLTEKKRETLYEELRQIPGIEWSVAFAEPDEIAEFNILVATHRAMARAAKEVKPDYCLIDGLPVKAFPFPSEGIVKGDSKSYSIAAASIFAKVTRDRVMQQYAVEFPQYGFEKHKGYGTAEHLKAIRHYGPCRIHRLTFQPLAQYQLGLE